jgi:hypothetical protein
MCHKLNNYLEERIKKGKRELIKQKNSGKFRERLNFVFENIRGPIIEFQKTNELNSSWDLSNNSLEFEEIGYIYNPTGVYVCLNSKDETLFRYIEKNKKSIIIPGFGFYTKAFTDEKRTPENLREFLYLPENTFNFLNTYHKII